MDANTKTKHLGYNIAKRVALISIIFAALLSVLMIANYLQTTSVDPLNSAALSRLMLDLQQNPEDAELKEQIRALDLLARKAYFTHQWQLRTGGYLLFAFVLVFLISLKYMKSMRAALPNLTDGEAPIDTWENALLSRKSVVYGGLSLFVLAFILGVLSENSLISAGTGTSSAAESAADYPSIEDIRNNWPGFRGPEGIGIAYQAAAPTEWDGKEGKNILWKISLPHPGFNSPILWGKKLFLSGADRSSQAVYCIDADSGDMIWQTELNDIPGSPPERPNTTEDTGLAASTLTTDGTRVFAIFATGDMACLDFEGKRLWAKNLGMPDNHYGHASSLISYQDLVLIQFDQNIGGNLVALNSATGDVVYEVERETAISWASPILVNTGSRDEVILNSNPFVISYDPRTGRELWRVRCMQGEIAPSPAYAEGMVFVVNEYARMAAIKLGPEPEVAWEYLDDLSEVSSPLAAKGLVLMPASYGTVTCLDAATGEQLWFQDFDEGFYSSPVLVGDNVYLMDMMGVMYIFKADREYQLVGQCDLGERGMTIPAFMHDRIYIRGEKHLFCIGN